ncbi:hypothetical protein [Spartinivicinus ruber]|uniref:hypothetical protein n=1 Tax=Spartinivicinus ruber TaxID=2683272 RepID=UPI0013D1C7C1|nr:hypothetical protein [Spartinivicinus ruber]
MSDYNLRQLEKMHLQISAYKDGKIDLRSLIEDLMFLRDALEEVEQKWEHDFTDRIIDLESAYSYALEKNAGNLDSLTQKIVEDALPKLQFLIEQKKQCYLVNKSS